MHRELSPLGFTVITVALDKDPEDARPWIEAAKPEHPSLIDTEFAVADLYNMVNVPTTLWIDEGGDIVRPNDVGYATDTFRSLTRVDSARVLTSIRAWVRDGVTTLSSDEARAVQSLADEEHQLARTEFNFARWLQAHGRDEAAERHFVRAGELAPYDFTIRRGSLPMRGIDPMGPVFGDMVRDWVGSGNSYYRPLPD